MQAKWQGFANRIPVVGGALAGLATPAGLATAAIGLTVGVLTKMVTKTLDLGRSLGRPAKSWASSAEGIQIWLGRFRGNQRRRRQLLMIRSCASHRSIGEAGDREQSIQESLSRLIGLSYEDLANNVPGGCALKPLLRGPPMTN